jgi:hypothetical protein
MPDKVQTSSGLSPGPNISSSDIDELYHLLNYKLPKEIINIIHSYNIYYYDIDVISKHLKDNLIIDLDIHIYTDVTNIKLSIEKLLDRPRSYEFINVYKEYASSGNAYNIFSNTKKDLFLRNDIPINNIPVGCYFRLHVPCSFHYMSDYKYYKKITDRVLPKFSRFNISFINAQQPYYEIYVKTDLKFINNRYE